MKHQLKTHIAKLRAKITLLNGIFNDDNKQGEEEIARSTKKQMELLKTEIHDLNEILNYE